MIDVYVQIYKQNKMQDFKRLKFEEREHAMLHIEKLKNNRNYHMIAFGNKQQTEVTNETYNVRLKRIV